MTKLSFLFYLIISILATTSKGQICLGKGSHMDTVLSNGEGYSILHYHCASDETLHLINSDSMDKIFDTGWNHFSRLCFSNPSLRFEVATVPLTNVVFLKNSGVIIGLSTIMLGEYHIVIYDTNGKLLTKRTLSTVDMKLNRKQINRLIKKYPSVRDCITDNTVVIKRKHYYYYEMSPCLMKKIPLNEPDAVLVRNSFFPRMMFTLYEPGLRFMYNTFLGSFDPKNPVDSLIIKKGKPQALILNSEDGRKVKVPLVSNCDVSKL